MDRTLVMVIAPLVILQLALLTLGYVDLSRRESVRGGKKWVWALVLLLSFVGPLMYFVLGREE